METARRESEYRKTLVKIPMWGTAVVLYRYNGYARNRDDY